jgi:hypothetical protein
LAHSCFACSRVLVFKQISCKTRLRAQSVAFFSLRELEIEV